jgi:periplasmic protein CpxP/Spy
MSKVKLLRIITVLMLLCNIFLMYQVWNNTKDKPPRRGEGSRNEIIERLHFDDVQTKHYDEYIYEHREAMGKFDERMRVLKQELYATLLNNQQSTKQDSLINLIANTQKEIEQVNLDHFKKIGSICTNIQKPAFDSLVTQLSDLFMDKRRPQKRL